VANPESEKTMKNNGAKSVAILIEDVYQEMEVWQFRTAARGGAHDAVPRHRQA
jgi:hypothetical protein